MNTTPLSLPQMQVGLLGSIASILESSVITKEAYNMKIQYDLENDIYRAILQLKDWNLSDLCNKNGFTQTILLDESKTKNVYEMLGISEKSFGKQSVIEINLSKERKDNPTIAYLTDFNQGMCTVTPLRFPGESIILYQDGNSIDVTNKFFAPVTVPYDDIPISELLDSCR